MLYKCKIEGIAPLLMHSGKGLDPRHPLKIEIAKITSKGSKRTDADEDQLREHECAVALWLDNNDKPTIPTNAIRSSIEKAAKKSKEGAAVREGLLVLDSKFTYDTSRYGKTLKELSISTQYTVGVNVNGKGVMRTRAMFETPWSCEISIDTDDSLIEKSQLTNWLTISGQRIGLGNWRPEKSGIYGRFKIKSVAKAKD